MNKISSPRMLLLTSAALYVIGQSHTDILPETPSSPNMNKIEIVGYTLGDSHRSVSSSHSFFQSMDTDHDGNVHPSELANFFKLSIGGTHLDEDVEIQREVDSVMSKLDRDHNNALDTQDIFGYWTHQLETLLTVDEVAEWVVYAIQLPPDIGQIFRLNHVTGYDFPELVENNGQALITELKIDKPSFRKRIVRLARARMLGIGSLPDAPHNITIQVEQCSAIAFSWMKCEAKGFPVHSYRIQRRTIGGSGNTVYHTPHFPSSIQEVMGEVGERVEDHTCKIHRRPRDSSSSYCPTTPQRPASFESSTDGAIYYASSSPESWKQQVKNTGDSKSSTFSSHTTSTTVPWIQTLSLPVPSEWQTLYVGAETQYVDTRVEKGKEYNYRIQAWSSIGRSVWTHVDVTPVWKKDKCHIPPKKTKKIYSLLAGGDVKTTQTMKPLEDDRHHPNDRSSHAEMKPVTFTTFSFQAFCHFLWILVQGIGWMISCTVTFSHGFLAITAFVAGAMKFRRMNLATTTSLGDPIFPWLWRSLNRLSRKYIGHVIFPHYVTGDEKLKKKASDLYDRQVKSVGLFGYKETFGNQNQNTTAQRLVPPSTVNESLPSAPVLKRDLSTKSLSFETESTRESSEQWNRSRMLGRSQSSSVLINYHNPNIPRVVDKATSTDAHDELQSTSTPLPTTANNRGLFTRRKFFSFTAESQNPNLPPITSTISPLIGESENRGPIEEDRESNYSVQSLDPSLRDDFDRCNTCHKVYKFLKRSRHHCSRCAATFCHKHGRTTHINLISCKVPGNCVCLPCIQKESVNSTRM